MRAREPQISAGNIKPFDVDLVIFRLGEREIQQPCKIYPLVLVTPCRSERQALDSSSFVTREKEITSMAGYG